MFEDLLKKANQSLKGTPFGLMGETLASGAVGQDPVTGEIPEGLSIIQGLLKSFFDIEPEKPKAHDEIDSLMQKNKIYASDNAQLPLSSRETSIGPIPEGGLSSQDILDMIMPFGGMGRIAKIGRTAAQKAAALARKKWWQQTHLLPKAKDMLKPQSSKYKSYDPNAPGQYIEGGKESAKSFLEDLFESFKGKEF